MKKSNVAREPQAGANELPPPVLDIGDFDPHAVGRSDLLGGQHRNVRRPVIASLMRSLIRRPTLANRDRFGDIKDERLGGSSIGETLTRLLGITEAHQQVAALTAFIVNAAAARRLTVERDGLLDQVSAALGQLDAETPQARAEADHRRFEIIGKTGSAAV